MKKSGWNKWPVLSVGLALMLSACSSNVSPASNEAASPASSSSAANETSKPAEPLEFTYYDHNDATVREPWGKLPATKWILDNKKVSIDWISANGASSQKLNTMIVGSDLPDVLNIPRAGAKIADINRLIEGGLVVPIDDYINKYPNLKEWATMDNLNLLRAADGKIYEIPVWFNKPGSPSGNYGWMVNSKIYKELGSPKLETTDDLENYLHLVKEKYPDVIPLEVGAQFDGAGVIFSAFRENTPRFFLNMQAVAQGDKLIPITEDAAYQEFVGYVNRLFQDKLITQDAFTQTLNQVQEKINSGRVAVYAGNVSREGRNSVPAMRQKDPESGYDAIWPIRKEGLDKNKIFPEQFSTVGSNSILISKSAKDPEGIFAFLDWSVGTEGQAIQNFGPPGLFWDKQDEQGAPIPNDQFKQTPASEYTKQINGATYIGNASYTNMAKEQRESKLPENQRDWEATQQFNVIWKTSYDVTAFFNAEPLPGTPEGILAQQVKDIYDQAFNKAVFAKSADEVSSIMAKADEDMKKAGIDKLLKYRTDMWQKNVNSMAESNG